MPSFDIVSKVDISEVENAVNNTVREVATRYDFRNSNTTVNLDKKEYNIHVVSADSMKMDALKDMLQTNCIRRKVDIRCMEFKKTEPTSQGYLKRDVKINEGISKEQAQQIVKLIKKMNLKVQASIQDEQVRVTGKKIDDLQNVIQEMRRADLEIPLQFINMK